MTTPKAGAETEVALTVTLFDTAARLGIEPGEARFEVLATRTMIGEMESAATKRLRPYLRGLQLLMT